MRIRLYEDYYHCCCEWCDTENRVLWARLQEGATCGACHRKLFVEGTLISPQEKNISSGLY